MNQSNLKIRKFHFMVAAQVVFRIIPEKAGDPVEINTANVNTVITSDKDQIPASMVGKAQQGIQLQLLNRLGENAQKIEIVDVVILNFMNLGYMTDLEFQVPPEGTQKQEVAKTGLSLVQ